MDVNLSDAVFTREVLKFAPQLAAYNADGQHVHLTSSSSDPHFLALAQLGTYRLDATRCLISFFDTTNQYVVAEASPDSEILKQDSLWLGGSAIPRSLGICEHLLVGPPTDELPVSIVPDLDQDVRFCDRPFIRNPPYNRFYAGVPIRTPRGINIGAYCVFDDKPRDGLRGDQVRFMREISQALMGYLETKRARESSRRSERMVRGIGSFVEGNATMSRWWLQPNADAFEAAGRHEGNLNVVQQELHQQGKRSSNRTAFDHPVRPSPVPLQSTNCSSSDLSASSTSSAERPNSGTPVSKSTESAHSLLTSDSYSDEVKKVFSKAANIIRESIEVEGVVFFDASVGSFGGLVRNDAVGDSSASDTPTSLGSNDGASEDQEKMEKQPCEIFGFSTSENSSIDPTSTALQNSISEKFLKRLLKRFRSGKIFNFTKDGTLLEDSDEHSRAESVDPSGGSLTSPDQASKGHRTRPNEAEVLASLFPGATSVVLVPLWYANEERWFAGGLMWTMIPTRTFTVEGELSYLRAFGKTIMAEINTIDMAMSEKVKVDLLGSISHELRSPLHGIVAAVELLHDTVLDAFQGDLLHSTESCARTLLDVIDHLLDYSKINRFAKNPKTAAKESEGIWADRKASFQSRMRTLYTHVQLDALVEETVESVFAGYNFQKLSISQMMRREKEGNYDVNAMRRLDSVDALEAHGYRPGKSGLMEISLGAKSIHLDIDPAFSWTCEAPPGVLRRIIMNIFGNSLKFTVSGFIIVKLDQEVIQTKGKRRKFKLKLTVTDSGKGIKEDFLQHQAFSPFSQEDTLSSGAGLGLSIVQQITKALGGTLNVQSQVGIGTRVTVCLPLSEPPMHDESDTDFTENVRALAGLRVGLRGLKTRETTTFLSGQHPRSEFRYLEALCRDWFHMEIVMAGAEDIQPDLIICSEESLDKEVINVATVSTPVVIICQDALTAHALKVSYQQSKKHRIIEFISQPAGPRKTAKALRLAMTRWKDFLAAEMPTPDNGNTPIPTPNGEEEGPMIDQLDAFIDVGATPRHVEQSPPTPAPDFEQDGTEHMDPNFGLSYLLVDDNRLNLMVLEAFMKKLRVPYATAINGLDALELYMKLPGRFCGVIMDISMPVMDGFESTRRIRHFEKKRNMKPATIIALTGLASSSTQKEAFGSGIDVFMTKPARLKDLAGIVTNTEAAPNR